MRLINTTTLELENGFDSKTTRYAILSHTWSDHEVSLQAYRQPLTRSGAGYQKIVECCRLASAAGINHAWIDTCCIDKTNSVELTEAIQSMFTWYEDAVVCYAFLDDILSTRHPRLVTDVELRTCKWFYRGWTLQELLAPHTLYFFDQEFQPIGSRQDLAVAIASVTTVPKQYLLKRKPLREACIAQRLSWVAKRETTRPEDIAYCLFGIFNVNMPLYYGEGGKKHSCAYKSRS